MTMNLDVQQHPALLEQLTAAYPNSIRVLPSRYPINRYTCLMHVLDFSEKPNYIAIATYPGINVYAGAEFARWLVEKGYLAEVSEAQAVAGDLGMYFDGCNFKHVGILQENARVISKWGEGHLYDHALWEVPESYGDSVRFFRPLSYDNAFEYFTHFAEEHGIPIENAESLGAHNAPRTCQHLLLTRSCSQWLVLWTMPKVKRGNLVTPTSISKSLESNFRAPIPRLRDSSSEKQSA